MSRIGAVGRVGAAQDAPARVGAGRADAAVPAQRALVVVAGGRFGEPGSASHTGSARSCAGFIAQLLVATDPDLRPSRLERTQSAAARYAETARRLA